MIFVILLLVGLLALTSSAAMQDLQKMESSTLRSRYCRPHDWGIKLGDKWLDSSASDEEVNMATIKCKKCGTVPTAQTSD